MCLAVLLGVLAAAGHVRACEPGPVVPRSAIPRAGAANVAPATQLLVLADTEPAALSLTVAGAPSGIFGIVLLGPGRDGRSGGRTSFWHVGLPSGALQPGAQQVLTETGGGAAPRELTRFTTAAAGTAPMSTPPVLRAIRLWRVHYATRQPDGADCVTAADQGFIALDDEVAVVPGTPPDSVVHTIRLAPRAGGAAQVFLFTGPAAYAGAAPSASGFPTPAPADWHPELDPALEYCAVIEAAGFGTFGQAPLVSDMACAPVTLVEAPQDAGGCCAVAGTPARPGARDAVLAAAAIALAVAARRTRRRPVARGAGRR